jgi:hypothetical protein
VGEKRKKRKGKKRGKKEVRGRIVCDGLLAFFAPDLVVISLIFYKFPLILVVFLLEKSIKKGRK